MNVKNAKKIILTNGAVILLLSIILIPCINATIPKKDTVKTTTEDIENGSKIVSFGSIAGYIYYVNGWIVAPIPLAPVDVKTKQTLSNFNGYYKLQKLSLGQTYTITVYASGFKSQTKVVELSENKPDSTISFELEKEKSDNKKLVSPNICNNKFFFLFLFKSFCLEKSMLLIYNPLSIRNHL